MAIDIRKKAVKAPYKHNQVNTSPLGYDNLDEVLKDFIVTVDKDLIITSDDNMVTYRESTAKWVLNEDKRIIITVRTFHHIKDIVESLMWAFHNDVRDTLDVELKCPCVVLGYIRNNGATRFITANTYNAAMTVVNQIFGEE